ncbi:benzoyl-CoA reductase [Frondihabitans sp. PAMC 28766]|uniref:2-hydroxyacyl-CoA dehydratase subunit D n=1 Tax=Frondihabitans sp. PAMC 28766 TaxID=1795630 RepID=UPI00078C73A4|nr:2-hydroxyacyl-CoA dehydratase family protein [Frondihabitans sp. PAMC 28766]AMM21868.1 benzoyl-CoA reductase [Frondihabitans sp. PAMC 28766]
MSDLNPEAYALLASAAADPVTYAQGWKARTGHPVVGSFPMNFPSELTHATGALPVVIQESRTPITEGRSLLPEFYCGYTRSLADQAAVGELDVFDAFVLADHCVQLLGAVDVIRWSIPSKPVHFAQFISSMDDPWSGAQVRDKIGSLRVEVEEIVGTVVTAERLANSIRLFNENRRILREFYDLRRQGVLRITASEMQTLVKSSMVMDIEEHTAILLRLRDGLTPDAAAPDSLVRIHLSGHFCAPPRPELLDVIEECGVLVVNDDLYHGFRYISTDVPEDVDPFDALALWYLDRNVNAPCGTRVQRNVDWDSYLVSSLDDSAADGVITLMSKFCEPLMLYYPELKKALDGHDIPVLLIETEHEGLAEESVRTRVETFVERIRRSKSTVPSLA